MEEASAAVLDRRQRGPTLEHDPALRFLHHGLCNNHNYLAPCTVKLSPSDCKLREARLGLCSGAVSPEPSAAPGTWRVFLPLSG